MTTPEPLPQSELERIKALCEQPYTGIQIYLSKCVAEVERLKFRFDQQSKTNTLLCEELTRLQTELADLGPAKADRTREAPAQSFMGLAGKFEEVQNDDWNEATRADKLFMKKEYKHAEIIGPFTEPEWSYAVIDGYRVPYIKLLPLSGEKDGKIEIHVEGTSCCFIIDDSSIDIVLSLLAKAMAVAAGYNKHGDGSEKHNPFKVKMIGL